MPSCPPDPAPPPASSDLPRTLSPTASPAALLSSPQRTPPHTSSTAANSSTNTSPPPPPRPSSPRNLPTPPGALTASRCSKPPSWTAPPTLPPNKQLSTLTSSTPIAPSPPS